MREEPGEHEPEARSVMMYSDFEGVLEATHDADAADMKRIDKLEEEEEEGPPEVLMDAVHESTFDGGEFWQQLVLHMFFPVSLLWYPSERWPQGAFNQELISPRAWSNAWHLTSMWCWFLLVAYCVKPSRFNKEGILLNELFTVPFILVTSRNVLIALKYATFTKQEKARFFKEKDRALVHKWLMQTQLISGWLSQRDDVLRSELLGAATRLSLTLQDIYFVVEPMSGRCDSTRQASVKAWDHLVRSGSSHLAEHFDFKGNQYEHISCEKIIQVLLHAARAKAPIISSRKAALFSLFLAFLPRIISVFVTGNVASILGARSGPRIARGQNPDSFVVVCILVSMGITFMAGGVFLIFLSVNIAHYYRMATVSRWFSLLIRVSFDAHPHFPQIQLCEHSRFGSHNTLAWIQCRSILCYFGKRYEHRLDAYMFMTVILAIIAISVPVLRLLQAGGFGGAVADDDELRDHLNAMKRRSFLWIALFLFAITMVLLTVTVLFAADGNAQFENALSALSQHRLKLRAQRCDSTTCVVRTDDDDANLSDSSERRAKQPPRRVETWFGEFEETLELAKTELDVLNRIHALRVLGQPADKSMAFSIATSATTVVGYILAALFGLLL